MFFVILMYFSLYLFSFSSVCLYTRNCPFLCRLFYLLGFDFIPDFHTSYFLIFTFTLLHVYILYNFLRILSDKNSEYKVTKPFGLTS